MIASERAKLRELLPPETLLPPHEEGAIRFSRSFLEILEEADLVKGRYELLEGRIISKMGQNSPHNITVVQCLLYLAGNFDRLNVRSQTTMEVREDDRVTNRPEPDVMLLREPTLVGAPSGDNVLLTIEVSDTTQTDDFETKTVLYARAGVTEYWVIDLPRRTLTMLRQPNAVEGSWAERTTFFEADSVAPEVAPDNTVRIADLLPPVT